MRKEFQLPEGDLDYLASLGLPWETFREANNQWLLIHDFPLPSGFNVPMVDVALLIDPGYPVAQIDMAYFFPHLVLLSNRPIGALAGQPLEGKIYQRWSRHRTPVNPWRPGVDDLSTHMSAVNSWFERELKK